ncbi:MAG: hypothetical protein GY797_23490 [Deltaproteobacteria bacterium]|nr:hypothetical protein [Deltaproteobacteria bacterium]
MRDVNSIIEEYRNSDFEKRMYLFLEHRALRNQFTEIDTEELQTEYQTRPIWVAKPERSAMGQLISALRQVWST